MSEEPKEEVQSRFTLDIRIIIVAIAIIFLAAAIAFVVAKMVVTPPNEQTEAESNQISVNIGPTYELNEFTVNLADSNGRRFIRTQMIFVMSENRLRRELDDKRPLIRDRIITILAEKTIEDIETAAGKEALKKEIINTLNPLLVNGEIEEIYFDSFVFQ